MVIKSDATQSIDIEPKWIHLEMQWRERLPNGSELNHIYRPVLNRETGALYTDNKISFVAKKSFGIFLVRPIHVALKTLYHICLPISIPREIYLAVKKEMKTHQGNEQNIGRLIQVGISASLKNIADIVRTPIYGIALVASLFATFILGLMNSERTYDLRAITGKIELSLVWGDKKSIWMLAPCFQETQNLKDLEATWGQITHPDTNYDELTPIQKAAANLARGVFQHRRRNRAIVYCCKPWPKHIALDSATYRTC